jgi:hypothetical protein
MITAVEPFPTSAGTADDDARWAEAARLAERPDTPLPPDQLRRRRRVMWTLLGVVLVACLGAGLLAYLLSDGGGGDGGGGGSDVADWREVLSLVVAGVGLLTMLAGAVSAWRAGVWRTWRTTQPESALTRAQVKELSAEVRGRAPVPPDRLGLARHLAQRLARQRALLPFWSGLVLVQAARFIDAEDLGDLLLPAVSVGCFVLLLVLLIRQSGHGRAFLRRHPAPSGDGAAAS